MNYCSAAMFSNWSPQIPKSLWLNSQKSGEKGIFT